MPRKEEQNTPAGNPDEKPIRRIQADRLRICETADQVSEAAVSAIAFEIRRLVGASGRAIGIFDGNEGLRDLFGALSERGDIPWTRVIGLQLAEIKGADSRRRVLIDNLVGRVPMAEFHGIRGEAANPEAVRRNYEALLDSRPPDFAVLSIEAECFSKAGPERVTGSDLITLTMPVILSCGAIFIAASGAGLAEAVREALTGGSLSILRNHPGVRFLLDREAAAGIE
ncbi:MAG: hypothetical protein IPM66_14200 [Acidobacteriota bacterium]|nr:MAG: hypothetical protein IPM66_14200 [Acidobacteriota bacterium]